jgi:hypothetical protein
VRPVLTIAVAVVMASALVACGTSSPDRPASRRSDPPPRLFVSSSGDAVVARVGARAITAAMVAAAVRAEQGDAGAEPLQPPGFDACVARLRSEAAAIGASALPASQLRGECGKRLEEALQTALERLISEEWLVEGAREAGAPVGGGLRLEARAERAVEAIRRAVYGSIAPVEPAQVLRDYRAHRFEYLAAGERNLEIVRAASLAAAAKAKAEIVSGRSFARVAKEQSPRQPVDSSEGVVLRLQPHFYGEPNLNEAIFTARPGVLTGPVDTWFGYFVFEVTKVLSEHETPLAQVRAAIQGRLEAPRRERALAAFLQRWRATWKGRTDCGPGAVVPDCRQFQGPAVATLEVAPAPG